MFRHNLLIFYRSATRYKSSFFINLIGLSTGLACTLLIFLWVQDEYSVDKYQENDKQLYQVMQNLENSDGNIQTIEATPGILPDALAAEIPEIEYAASVVERVWNIAQALGHGGMFINQNSPGITEDHVFVNRDAKIPMIDIIDYDSAGEDYFGPYHHTHADNMQIIDKATLKAVGQTILQTLYEEGNEAI